MPAGRSLGAGCSVLLGARLADSHGTDGRVGRRRRASPPRRGGRAGWEGEAGEWPALETCTITRSVSGVTVAATTWRRADSRSPVLTTDAIAGAVGADVDMLGAAREIVDVTGLLRARVRTSATTSGPENQWSGRQEC